MGMVLGNTSGITSELSTALKVVGMQHVVSASGFNVGLIAWLGSQISSKWRSHRVSFVMFNLCLVWVYVAVAGGSLSLLRAAVMFSLGAIAQILCRQYRPAWGLIWSVVLLVIWKPEWLESISLQLSAAASWGILTTMPVIEKWQSKNTPQPAGFLLSLETLTISASPVALATSSVPMRRWLSWWWRTWWEGWWITLAAQLYTWPLLLHHFVEFSWWGMIVNPFLLWMTPFLTFGGLVQIGTHLVIQVFPAISLVSWLIDEIMSFFVGIFSNAVFWFAQFDGGLLKFSQTWPWTKVFLSWATVFCLVMLFDYFGSKRNKYD
jgi:competence protein ComEC